MIRKKSFFTRYTCLALITFIVAFSGALLAHSTELQKKLHEFAHQMPKTQLHVHLEGSVAPDTIIEIAKRNHIKMPYKNKKQFYKQTKFSSFEDFVTFFKQIMGVLKTPKDFTQIAYEYGKESARNNICYSEVIFSLSSNCMASGLDWQTIVKAINIGRERAQKEFNISWNWIFDLTRTKFFQPEEFVDILLKARKENYGLVAMGLSETLITKQAPEFQTIFDKAHKANLPIIPHAGEFQGPVSIWNSLNYCNAPRLDHGVRCIEDAKLVQKLAEQQTPLDICVTSNVRLGVYPNYKQHPIRYLWDAGLCININTDDPGIFGIDLNHEYDLLIDTYRFTIEDLKKISLNGITASLLPDKEKKELTQKFKDKFTKLRTQIFGRHQLRSGSPRFVSWIHPTYI
ncbi:MAG: adenosine deaminase [bacterium]